MRGEIIIFDSKLQQMKDGFSWYQVIFFTVIKRRMNAEILTKAKQRRGPLNLSSRNECLQKDRPEMKNHSQVYIFSINRSEVSCETKKQTPLCIC